MARRQIEGKILTAYGQTNEEAEAALREKVLDLKATRLTPHARTLHEAAKAWWFPGLTHLAHQTQRRYTSTYVEHIREVVGQVPIAEIRRSHCQEVMTKAAEKLAPKSLQMVKSVLHQILHCAEAEGVIMANPARFIKLPQMPEKRHRVLTVEEAGKLLDAVEGTDLAAPVFLACVLGLRRGELLGLHWSDLDRVAATLTVQRQRKIFQYGKASKKAPEVKETPLKTSSSKRVLHLSKGLIEELDSRGDLDSGWICTRGGKPWLPDTLTEVWIERRAALGLPDWSFHDLRHGAAGLIYAATGDLLMVAAVLGHSKPDMSLVYTGVTDARRAEAGQKLSDLLRF
jgi:integrase